MRLEKHPISAPHGSVGYELHSLHFGAPGKGKKVYIQAALHADEPPGMLVAQFLRTRLGQLDAAGKIAGEIILVPAANPIGRAQAIQGAAFGRFDLTTGVNFNRDFKHVAQDLKLSLASLLNQDVAHNIRLVRSHARAAIAALRPATDADTLKKTLLQLAIDADIVLDLHCDNDAVLHLYAGTPLADAVQPLSALLGAQALLLSWASGGEAFDEACSRLWWDLDAHFGGAYPIPPACMAVTVELRGTGCSFLMWYAARIKANPEKSPTYILDQTRRKELAVDFNNVSGSSYQLLRTALSAGPTSRRHSTFIRMAF